MGFLRKERPGAHVTFQPPFLIVNAMAVKENIPYVQGLWHDLQFTNTTHPCPESHPSCVQSPKTPETPRYAQVHRPTQTTT